MAGRYPGIVKTKLDGVNQFDYYRQTEKSARDTFFYYTGVHAIGGAVQELEDIFHDRARNAEGPPRPGSHSSMAAGR